LQNSLERAAILSENSEISLENLGLASSPTLPSMTHVGPLRDLEREAIRQTLLLTSGHRKRAAERLGIGLRTLYDKIKEYGLS
jgi:two-component system response regulator AtoC